MEVDFDFELKSDKTDLGLHSMKESWLYYLREEDPATKHSSPNSSPSNDEDLSVFSYRDLNLYGTTPILESFSALSFPAILPATNRDNQTSSTGRISESVATQSSTRLEVPTYSGSTNKSRKRLNNTVHYSESEHDSAFSSHSPSTGSSSSLYNQESLDSFDQASRSQSLLVTSVTSESSTSSSSNKNKRVCTSNVGNSASKRLYTNVLSSVHSSETSARTSGIVTANNPRINFNNSRNSQPERNVPVTNNQTSNNSSVKNKTYLQEDLSLPQLIAEILLPFDNVLPSDNARATAPGPGEPPEAAACRARTELIALQASTPDSLLPDSVPTVADSPETAGSPTKPTDEPALPDEQPVTQSSSPIINTFDSLTMSNMTPPSLINISPDEFDVSVLKEQHPELFTPEEPPPINEPTAKQFVKYDPFIKNPDIIEDTYEDSLEPRRKMIKFKFSPFNVVETDQTKSLKPPLTNLFIMELEEPNEPLQPLPCGVYEIESTKPYYRITPYPGIYETSDESKDSKSNFRRANSPSNFIFDEGGLSWKRSKLDSTATFNFEFDAPPTPQTPVCMKRVHTAEELSYCNIFSGLYVLDTQQPEQTESSATANQSECSVVKLPQLTGIYRQLATKPHSRPNVKTGNAITRSLLRDFQMNSTLRNIFA